MQELQAYINSQALEPIETREAADWSKFGKVKEPN